MTSSDTVDPRATTHPEDEGTPQTQGGALVGDRYELLAMLGAGGMGNVYRARDLELDEEIALKVLKPDVAGAPGAIERFRREVKLARRVTHPNVARVFDIGELGGQKSRRTRRTSSLRHLEGVERPRPRSATRPPTGSCP